MTYKKLPITVLIMTQNEELNIKYAIESVKEYFDQIIVTDSFSTDKTVEICKNFPEVELYQHQFEGWAEQRNWMLEHCEIRNDLIFCLDADEYIKEDFVAELKSILNSGVDFDAIFTKCVFLFLGKRLKYAYGHPKVLRIFKKEGLYFKGEGAREYAFTKGNKFLEMKTPFYHEDHRSIDFWIQKHLKNAGREAVLILMPDKHLEVMPNNLEHRVRLWIRRKIWEKIPLMFRPFIYFIARYFFQLGFLDGKEGFIYCFLHAFWYPMIINIKIWERQKYPNG